MAAHTFYKYQGAGNDFLIFDNRKGAFDRNNVDLVRHLCDRRFGVGADGLMLLQDKEAFDFEMVYYNADGHEGSMCGNGGRCIVAFARDQGMVGERADFLAVDGPHQAYMHGKADWISLKMSDVTEIKREGDAYLLNTGSPHYVKLVSALNNYPVVEAGRKIRYSDPFREQGVNVNFVEPEGAGYYVRTYERGVEDETLACGTGATAVALAMAWRLAQEGKIETSIRVAGGELTIHFNKESDRFTDIFLNGPAQFVFKGEVTW